MAYDAHQTAVIDDGARIGDGTRIWHFSHVMGGADVRVDVRVRREAGVRAHTAAERRVRVLRRPLRRPRRWGGSGMRRRELLKSALPAAALIEEWLQAPLPPPSAHGELLYNGIRL